MHTVAIELGRDKHTPGSRRWLHVHYTSRSLILLFTLRLFLPYLYHFAVIDTRADIWNSADLRLDSISHWKMFQDVFKRILLPIRTGSHAISELSKMR